uniref:Uncharacterized protein n=1 Tax=Sphaerodactylus townsendi TaxID=933632 RepID=A0ACB8F4A6_9SAUR
MRTLFSELADRGLHYDDSHKAYLLISSLDESWESLVNSLQTVADAALTLDYVTSKLLDSERQREFQRSVAVPQKESTLESSSVLPAACATRCCYRCGAPEHLARACVKVLDRRKPNQDQWSMTFYSASQD